MYKDAHELKLLRVKHRRVKRPGRVLTRRRTVAAKLGRPGASPGSAFGEGFGRTYVESMACGMLNIVPKHTAIKEYANMSNALMVGCKEEPVGARPNELRHLIGSWFKVQVPDYDQLRAAMRVAFEEDCSVFKKNAVKINQRFTNDNTKEQIREAFEL